LSALSQVEIEALLSMLAQHKRLWAAVATECGVEVPDSVPEKLVKIHRKLQSKLVVKR